MKIVIAGGTGQVGRILSRAFRRDGCSVVILSRGPARHAEVPVARWDGRSGGEWERVVDGADVVINLAGKNVDCRYHPRNRAEILRSRVDSTRAIAGAIRRAQRPPRVWLQASTATIYAHSFDTLNDEETGRIGGEEFEVPNTWRFSIDVARAWEAAAMEGAELPGTRRVLFRSAMTMSADRGGVFDVLLRLARFGLGGQMGNGRQYVSWIHERDFVGAIQWLIHREDIAGAVNLASPCPVPNAVFMRVLREAWGARLGLATPAWLLEIGAMMLRTETELVLKSRRVVPGRLLQSGFSFEFPRWPAAAADLCEQWRAMRRAGRSHAA